MVGNGPLFPPSSGGLVLSLGFGLVLGGGSSRRVGAVVVVGFGAAGLDGLALDFFGLPGRVLVREVAGGFEVLVAGPTSVVLGAGVDTAGPPPDCAALAGALPARIRMFTPPASRPPTSTAVSATVAGTSRDR